MTIDVVADTRVLQLLGDPHRWRLLAELAESDLRVGELTELVGKSQSLVSYHLGELRAAGVVDARRSAADGRDTYYRVDLDRCAELLVGAGAALHPALRLELVPPARRVEPPNSHPGGRTPKVLFLCTGNSARSQIAEALLEHRSGHTVRARSAGSHPKALHPHAVRVMAARGIDIGDRNPKPLSRFARSRFDRVITLCDKVKEVCPEFPGTPSTAHWSMSDPAAEDDGGDAGYAAFVRTADDIEGRVDQLIARLAVTEPTGRS